MKKFVLILIVCTLLCASLCLLLAGCDSSDAEAKDDAFNSNGTKIELVKKSHLYYDDYVEYTFRVWYPLEWFSKDYRGPQINYKTADDELKYVPFFAEFIATSPNPNYSYSMVPDSWLYFEISVPSSIKSVYVEVLCEVRGYQELQVMAQSTFSLT